MESGNKKTGKGLSPNTVNATISVLQNSLRTAFTLGLISDYFGDKIKRPKIIEKEIISEENRTMSFKMRPEQTVAVQKTIEYFALAKNEEPNKSPKFLWNAKMRFGKTFASYQLAKKMGFSRVLVLTFKPAVESAWREDLMTHVDFKGGSSFPIRTHIITRSILTCSLIWRINPVLSLFSVHFKTF